MPGMYVNFAVKHGKQDYPELKDYNSRSSGTQHLERHLLEKKEVYLKWLIGFKHPFIWLWPWNCEEGQIISLPQTTETQQQR